MAIIFLYIMKSRPFAMFFVKFHDN